ncbi:MAG: DUF2795 domain-containing protein [Rhodospirillales bacterium]|nr:DUF2795 domain-containing protein [Rhodospirillales bacterium]
MPLARQSTTHDIAQSLAGIDFPANRSKIIEYAKKNNANQNLLDALQKMPDEQYTSMADVFKGVGISEEGSQKS